MQVMDIFYVELAFFFVAILGVQCLAIFSRKVWVSLVLSLVNSFLFFLLILILGFTWLATTYLFLVSFLSYFSIITTSLFMSHHKDYRPKRRISPSFFFSAISTLALVSMLAHFFPGLKDLSLSSNSSLDQSAISLFSTEYAMLPFLLALLALPALFMILLLVRHDKPT